MKCPKCRNTMNRTKTKEHNYKYQCPKCHTVIGDTTKAKESDKD